MANGNIRDPAQLRRLLDAVLLIESDLSLPVVLRRIVEVACDLVHARYGALGVIDAKGETLSDFVAVGIDDETAAAIGDPPRGLGILGLLLHDPTALRLADLNIHAERHGFPPGHPPMTSFLGVPVSVRGAVYGNLYLTDKQGAPAFEEEDEQLLTALAKAAGIAIDNARMHARMSDFAVIAERERIARDLHDTVIQRLFATGLALQATVRLAQPEPAARILTAIDDLDDTIRQIRTTIFALEGPTPGVGVRDRLVDLAAEMTRALGFAPAIAFNGPIDAAVTDGVDDHLVATLREALSNVARHARASAVQVSVTVADDAVTLRVADNGVGLPETRTGEGRGLTNMERRAVDLGGTMTAASGPATGTIVVWSVPL